MTKAEKTKAYNRTKRGLVSRIYNHMIERSVGRGHRLPEFTKDELQDWLYSQKLFHELYSEWTNSQHIKGLKPSVDRDNNNIHYCFNNMTLMTWYENNAKARKEVKDGVLTATLTPIIQFSKDGEYLNRYYSIAEAARRVSGNKKAISMCIHGHSRTSSGFRWMKESQYEDSLT